MNYLISRFNCCVVGDVSFNLTKNVKYEFSNFNKNYFIFGKNGELPLMIDFLTSNNMLKVSHNNNCYFVISPCCYIEPSFFRVKHGMLEYFITLSTNLNIVFNNENILNTPVHNLTYSHSEVNGDLVILYFTGVRNFIVILQKEKVLCATFYDECNITSSEKLFMCRLFDSLNHGRVFKIKNNKFETYLVYLDDFELNLKPRFIGFVFLDCLLAKNFNYCNNLLGEDIKQKESKNIELFFPSFDYYFEAQPNEFVLINKNALAGIYKFDVNNLTITNIIQLNQ